MHGVVSVLISFAVAAGVTVAAGPVADADPAPGFDFDPGKLIQRMDACLAREVGPDELLMGWVNVRTGDTRQWRCSSLRHTMEDQRPSGPHDPYVDVLGFMRCADRVVSYGFPRAASDPKYTRYILQYEGTKKRGNVLDNDAKRSHGNYSCHSGCVGSSSGAPTTV